MTNIHQQSQGCGTLNKQQDQHVDNIFSIAANTYKYSNKLVRWCFQNVAQRKCENKKAFIIPS